MANNGIILEPTKRNGRVYLTLETEDVRRMGILRSTREEVITLTLSKKGKINFNYCWGIHCGCSYNYKRKEAKLFEQDHPDLLASIQREYNDGTLVYKYSVWDDTQRQWHTHTTTDINVALNKAKGKGVA